MTDQSLAMRQAFAVRELEPPSAAELAQMLEVAKMLVKAKMVPFGVKTAGQALALILTGRELKVGPLRSVQDLYHVSGNVGMKTQFMVALYRQGGHYHEILVKTATHCKVELHLKEGRTVIVELTRAKVDKLGYPDMKEYKGDYPNRTWTGNWVLKPQWKKDPVGMLYNRTMTLAIRTHASEVLYGMLTQEELQDRGLAAGESRLVSFLKQDYPDVWAEWAERQETARPAEGEQGEVIEGESRELPSPGDNGEEGPDPDGTPAVSRPYQPAHRKRLVQAEAAKGAQTLANSRRSGPLCGWLDALFPTDSKDAKTQQRYTLLRFFFEKDSSKNLTDGEVTALAKWVTVKEAGDYVVDAMSVTEAHMILRACVEAKGQQSFLDPAQQEQAGMQEILDQARIL